MQDKFELIPLEILEQIERHCSNTDLLNVAFTSRGNLTLFQPRLDNRRLLLSVVRGEHETVKSLLEENINLIYRKDKVTDYSGRTFNISAFEYALWALDKPMWTLMLKCIPKDEKGNEVLQILRRQYRDISGLGVTYTLQGQTITEPHFNFEKTIIKELQKLDNLCHPPPGGVEYK